MNLSDIKLKKSYLLEYAHGTPWAILQDKLDAIHSLLHMHSDGKSVDIASVEAAIGRELRNDFGVVNQDGNAIIPVHGVIAKKMNLMHQISGGVSTQVIQKSIADAIEDPSVHHIVLSIDSPGGTVDGTKELVDYIYGVRGKKPITAFIDGLGASAAYWIASAADEIVAYDTARVGSIGVIMTHLDKSKQLESQGIKATNLYAGKYKASGSDVVPLTQEAQDYLQAFVDKYYTMFVESVARNRSVSIERVLSDMADGRVFLGKDALQAGLIDKIGTFTTVFRKAGNAVMASVGMEISNTQCGADKKEDMVMNLQELKSTYPDLVQALETEIKDGAKCEVEAMKAKLVATEVQVKELTKTLSIVEEEAAAGLADNIKRSALAESAVPENLHAKVMGMVDYHSFVKDGSRFVSGSEAVTAFTDGFKAEVKDWEERLPRATGVVGVTESKVDVSGSSADDDTAYGRDLARRYAGKIRSDRN